MKKKRKSKQKKRTEDDLLFYLEFYEKFDQRFRKQIADKEIRELEEKLKKL